MNICSHFLLCSLFLVLFTFFFSFPFWIHTSYWDCFLTRSGFVSPGLLLMFCLVRFLPHSTQETGSMRQDWWMQPSSSSPHQHKLGWGVEHWVKITLSGSFFFFSFISSKKQRMGKEKQTCVTAVSDLGLPTNISRVLFPQSHRGIPY